MCSVDDGCGSVTVQNAQPVVVQHSLRHCSASGMPNKDEFSAICMHRRRRHHRHNQHHHQSQHFYHCQTHYTRTNERCTHMDAMWVLMCMVNGRSRWSGPTSFVDRLIDCPTTDRPIQPPIRPTDRPTDLRNSGRARGVTVVDDRGPFAHRGRRRVERNANGKPDQHITIHHHK